MGKDLKELVKAYERAGYIVKGSNHLKVYSPSGHMVTVLGCTPSDVRVLKNMRAMQRKLLAELT
jgi:hypothetical protein